MIDISVSGINNSNNMRDGMAVFDLAICFGETSEGPDHFCRESVLSDLHCEMTYPGGRGSSKVRIVRGRLGDTVRGLGDTGEVHR
jgi:hypothetical protein